MSSTSPAPGWHADPSGRHELRFFDGTAWTEHVSNWGVVSLDPLLTGSPGQSTERVKLPQQPEAPGWPPVDPPESTGLSASSLTVDQAVSSVDPATARRRRRRRLTAAIALALLLLLVAGSVSTALLVSKLGQHNITVKFEAQTPGYCALLDKMQGEEVEVTDGEGRTLGTGTLSTSSTDGCGTLMTEIGGVPSMPKYHIDLVDRPWVGGDYTEDRLERFNWNATFLT